MSDEYFSQLQHYLAAVEHEKSAHFAAQLSHKFGEQDEVNVDLNGLKPKEVLSLLHHAFEKSKKGQKVIFSFGDHKMTFELDPTSDHPGNFQATPRLKTITFFTGTSMEGENFNTFLKVFFSGFQHPIQDDQHFYGTLLLYSEVVRHLHQADEFSKVPVALGIPRFFILKSQSTSVTWFRLVRLITGQDRLSANEFIEAEWKKSHHGDVDVSKELALFYGGQGFQHVCDDIAKAKQS